MQTANREPARVLRTPRAAGAAGVVSALLLSAALVLIRTVVPRHPVGAGAWLANPTNRDALRTALDMVPFAGIFFLWFMGAVRDYVARGRADRFFDALFLGSGLLFIAMVFVLAAWVDALIGAASTLRLTGQLASWEFGRHIALTLLANYAMRMAAVFTFCTTTMGHRLGVFPRWLTWFGVLAGLVLMFFVKTIAWSELIFPAWILTLSGYVLWSTFRSPKARETPGAGE
jgi:hypothetical protein